MARLSIKSPEVEQQILLLRLGVNRVGRDPENDFSIQHATISTLHCEITLAHDGLRVRDCGSTNGTFLNGMRISEARLEAGQWLRLGDVELLVEDTKATVAIPKFELPRPVPPIVDADGSVMCRKHENRRAAYQCTYCLEILCEECIHKLRRRKGKFIMLCPCCSHPCRPFASQLKRKKRNVLDFLLQTVKMPFVRK